MKTEQVYLDLVRKYFPEVSYKEATNILWKGTPFPMRDDIPTLEKYLIEYKESLDNAFDVDNPSNIDRFGDFLDNLNDAEYERFENMIMREVQIYE